MEIVDGMNVDGIKITIENPVNELLHCKNLLKSIYVYDVYIGSTSLLHHFYVKLYPDES